MAWRRVPQVGIGVNRAFDKTLPHPSRISASSSGELIQLSEVNAALTKANAALEQTNQKRGCTIAALDTDKEVLRAANDSLAAANISLQSQVQQEQSRSAQLQSLQGEVRGLSARIQGLVQQRDEDWRKSSNSDDERWRSMDGHARKLREVENLANMMANVVCESAPELAYQHPTDSHYPLAQTDRSRAIGHPPPRRPSCHLAHHSSPTLSSTNKVRSSTRKAVNLDLRKRRRLRTLPPQSLALPLPLLLIPLPPLHPLQPQALAHRAQPQPFAPA